VTHEEPTDQKREHAVSDERDSAGSAGTGVEAGTGNEDTGDTGGQTAVVTHPLRPTGKRSRRGAVSDADGDTEVQTEGKPVLTKNGAATKTAKKAEDRPARNPLAFVWNYLQQVVAELRKVIWPNRKQMVTYTSVVLLFLAFMVALIGLADLGLARLVMLVFG
jgi:preprotein translocase subunit SecE